MPGCPDPPTIQCLEPLVANILNVAIRLLGIALFIMLFVGAFKYITSGGDPKKIQSAKGTLTYAIGGLLLALLGWFALLIIEQITGVKVTEFKIGP